MYKLSQSAELQSVLGVCAPPQDRSQVILTFGSLPQAIQEMPAVMKRHVSGSYSNVLLFGDVAAAATA